MKAILFYLHIVLIDINIVKKMFQYRSIATKLRQQKMQAVDFIAYSK